MLPWSLQRDLALQRGHRNSTSTRRSGGVVINGPATRPRVRRVRGRLSVGEEGHHGHEVASKPNCRLDIKIVFDLSYFCHFVPIATTYERHLHLARRHHAARPSSLPTNLSPRRQPILLPIPGTASSTLWNPSPPSGKAKVSRRPHEPYVFPTRAEAPTRLFCELLFASTRSHGVDRTTVETI